MTDSGTDPVTADWERFRRLPAMHNHWERPGWTPGRQSFHWFLTFNGAAKLHTLTATCQKQLAHSFLDPVPAAGLHLTVRRLAFTDEITPAHVEAAASKAADRCRAMAPFTLRVGPLAGSAGALRFTVTPWEPLTALRDITTDAAASAEASDGTAAESRPFRPHIGIAYCNRTIPTAAVLSRVTALRTLPTVDVHVQALDLVRLWRDNHTYQWETTASLPLGSDPTAPGDTGVPRHEDTGDGARTG